MIEADHHSSLHVDFGNFFPKTAFFILTQYRRVTDRRDGRTDGQTRCCGYYPCYHSVARVKIKQLQTN